MTEQHGESVGDGNGDGNGEEGAPEYQRWTPAGIITDLRRKQRPNEDSTAKADKPETIHQARTWDGNKNRYIRYGLCVKCASQAAWGHQIGWGRLEHYPCSKCAPIVQGFPQQSAHPGWRKVVHHSSLPAWDGEDSEDSEDGVEEGTPEWTV